MRPFSSSPSSYSYGRQQQRVWIDGSGGSGGSGGDGEGGGGEVRMMMHSSSTVNASSDVNGVDEAVGTSSGVLMEKEHMFDKVVTPSDVGKLNRLVIPKQHAEKYFPLDSSNNEKGLLLNFEDRNGKPWRFRYSYWNSSQSYVMTKGWSRFVKEKKLDAGDVVSFHRGAGESVRDRLFIDWRRRPETHYSDHHHHHHHRFGPIPTISLPPHQLSFQQHYPAATEATWNHHHQVFSPQPPAPYGYNYGIGSSTHNSVIFNGRGGGGRGLVVNGNPCLGTSGGIYHLRSMTTAAAAASYHHQERGGGGMVFESVPVVQGKAAAKRLRLFGVNMECPISDSDDCDVLSSSTTTTTASASTTLIPNSKNSPITSLQLSPCGYTNTTQEFLQLDAADKPNKSSSSSMSLDLDI